VNQLPHHTASAGRASRRTLAFLLAVVLAAGLAERAALWAAAPRYGYVGDHFDNIGMGLAMDRYGLKVYSVGPEDLPAVSGRAPLPEGAGVGPHTRPAQRKVNYPPLGLTLFYVQALLWRAVDPAQTANTFASRAILSIATVLAELILATAVYLLGRDLHSRRAGLLAAAVCWLLPPLAMNTAFWGQTDAWPLAAMVLALWLMLSNRWALAGLCLAVGALLKPQAVLMAPVVLFAAAMTPAGSNKPTPKDFLKRAGKVLGAGVAAVAVLSAPWTIADGLAWLRASYLANLAMYPYTTLMAFNVWYLDLLQLDAQPVLWVRDATITIAGLSKDAWGRIALLVVLVALAVLCWRRFRARPKFAVVLLAALWLWSAFLWPTRVHDRYILYCIPPTIVAATMLRRLWPIVAGLVILGAAVMSYTAWLPLPYAGGFNEQNLRQIRTDIAASLPDPALRSRVTLHHAVVTYWPVYWSQRQAARPWEYAATIFSVLLYFAGVGLALTAPPPEQQPHCL